MSILSRHRRRPGRRRTVTRRHAITLALVFMPPWTAALVVAGFILTLDDRAGGERISANARLHQLAADQPRGLARGVLIK
jgi:hypothetical protein